MNLPDLSILIQMAELYEVEIKELLKGEREDRDMEPEMKETLQMASDYTDMMKQKALKSARIVMMVMFVTCTIVTLTQILYNSQPSIGGETIVLLAGGLTYLVLLIKDGTWEVASMMKRTKKNNLLASIGTSAVISVLFYLKIVKLGISTNPAVIASLFFVVMTVVCYVILLGVSVLSNTNQKRH